MTNLINIDRSVSFNPEAFIGVGWVIEEQDERSLLLTNIDPDSIILETTLIDEGKLIKGEERLTHLKEKECVRLDASVFLFFWKNQNLIPEKWKEKDGINPTYIFFHGTILRNSRGDRYTLFLWFDRGGWNWSFNWLDSTFSTSKPSATLSL